jgi:hypothetical protein
MGYGPFGPTSTLTISSPSSIADDLLKSGIVMNTVGGGILLTSNQQDIEVTTYSIDGRLVGTSKANGSLLIQCDQSGLQYALVKVGNAHHMIPLQCIK